MEAIRAQARQKMADGPRTPSLALDADKVIAVLTIAERAHTDYTAPAPRDVEQMLRDDLLAERIVIEAYQEIIRWIGDADPTTRRLIERILGEEEEHAGDLVDCSGSDTR
ncbi:MAG: ferritin-like domain-containing protein [Actinocrinis sp.]